MFISVENKKRSPQLSPQEVGSLARSSPRTKGTAGNCWQENGVSCSAHVHAFKSLSRYTHVHLIVFKTVKSVHASRVASQVLRFHEYTRA